MLPHTVEYNSLLQIIMADGALFLNLILLGRVWQPNADYNGSLAHFKLKKEEKPTITICSRLPHLTGHIVCLEFQAIA
jgi:hypothetical protein